MGFLMARFLKKKDKTIGQTPGEPIFIGVQKVEKISLSAIDYDSDKLSENNRCKAENLKEYKKSERISWININGLHDVTFLKEISEIFDLHPLVVEDIANTDQRPKLEDHDDYIFIVTKMLRFNADKNKILNEQLSIILGKNFLITFQESDGDIFEPLRNRIRKKKGKIRCAGTDYLTYAILDSIVDNYLMITEKFGEKIEELEDTVLDSTENKIPHEIKNFKREMNFLKKFIKPSREFIFILNNLDSDLIMDQTRPFLKDLLDLSTHAVESVDTYREMLTDHLNLYNVNVGNKLNEIMKVLTIFSVIFIPLTFIAGIYGTNFEYLPELKYKYSYLVFWIVIILIAGGMLKFFKNKNWL